MPTVMTLSEAELSVPTYVPDDSYGLLGDGAIITWLKARGPVVGGAIVLGMSVVTGLVVGSVAVKVFGDKSKDRSTSFAGANGDRKWRRAMRRVDRKHEVSMAAIADFRKVIRGEMTLKAWEAKYPRYAEHPPERRRRR